MQNKKEFLINFLYYCVIIIISVFAIKYLLGPLSPFITSFITISSCRKIITKLEEISHSKIFASLIFTLFTITLLSLAVYGIIFGISGELTTLSKSISKESIILFIDSFNERLMPMLERLPFADTIKSIPLMQNTDGIISDFVAKLIPPIVSVAMKVVSFVPSAVIFICFMFISMFYIGVDYDRICNFLSMQLPKKVLETIDETKNVISTTSKELFKSYFLLTTITFLQLLIGFKITGIRYSLILSLIISLIDILPILGTGTILIPWATFCFLLGNMRTGICLIVLYIVILLFRRIAEPRIIGTNTGLSPLVALISIFIGLKFLGFWGIIVSPIIAVTIISLNKNGFIRLYKNFPVSSGEEIVKTRQKFLDFKKNDSQGS